MRKFLVSLLAASVLFAAATVSNAATIYLQVTDSSTNDWLLGIPTTNGEVTSLFSPLNGGLFTPFTDPFPNGLVYGQSDQIDIGGASVSGTWSPGTEAWFDVIASLSGSPVDPTNRRFTVKGKITGSVTSTTSTAFWKAYQIYDVDNSVVYASNVEADPISSVSSLHWNFDISGNGINLWVEGVGQTLNRVGISPPTSIEGSVDVPEPGTLAMLLGFGISGSLLVIRRRK